MRLIHEQSILAVCVAEFELFRGLEIRMLLFTTGGYANKLNLHFVFPFRTLPFNQFVKRASEDVHEEYFICPVSKPLLSFRATSFSSSVSVYWFFINLCKDKFNVWLVEKIYLRMREVFLFIWCFTIYLDGKKQWQD